MNHMKHNTLILPLLAGLFIAGCEKAPAPTPPIPGSTKPVAPAATPASPPATTPAATEKSADPAKPADPVKPVSTGSVPMDQSESAANIRITGDIRRAILDDRGMSTLARNCKITTEKGGQVSLLGEVESQAERDAIVAKANAVVGVKNVNNMLEIKAK
jgi:hyperosmotically inducible periplasmic protein